MRRLHLSPRLDKCKFPMGGHVYVTEGMPAVPVMPVKMLMMEKEMAVFCE